MDIPCLDRALLLTNLSLRTESLLPSMIGFAIGPFYCTAGPDLQGLKRCNARIAQLVEHTTENRGVGGSNPPSGTTFPNERKRLGTLLAFISKSPCFLRVCRLL